MFRFVLFPLTDSVLQLLLKHWACCTKYISCSPWTWRYLRVYWTLPL